MTAEDPLRARLRSLAAGAPELSAAASVYGEVLPRVRDADLRAAPLALSRDVAEGLLSRGTPLPDIALRALDPKAIDLDEATPLQGLAAPLDALAVLGGRIGQAGKVETCQNPSGNAFLHASV